MIEFCNKFIKLLDSKEEVKFELREKLGLDFIPRTAYLDIEKSRIIVMQSKNMNISAIEYKKYYYTNFS